MAKRIVFPSPGEVVLESWEPGPPGAGEVRVETHFSLISPGTEMRILHARYSPDSHFARMFSFPQIKTGVQAVGRIESVGEGVTSLARGDRVFMRQAHGACQVLPADGCTPVPDGLKTPEACWTGLAKTAFRAAWAAPFRPGGAVLVIGAGPVGQMTVRWAHATGCAVIAVADLSAARLRHADRGGATHTFAGPVSGYRDAIAALDDGRGPAIVVDTTGQAAVLPQALAVAARFGKVLLLGDTGHPERQCLTSDMMVKGLTVQATHDSHDRDGWTQSRVDRLFFAAVRRGRFDLSDLITDVFDPADCAAAYRRVEEAPDETLGIGFDWTGYH